MAAGRSFKPRWKVFISGVGAVVLGYIFLATGDITAAPVLLVVGYCFLIPMSFF